MKGSKRATRLRLLQHNLRDPDAVSKVLCVQVIGRRQRLLGIAGLISACGWFSLLLLLLGVWSAPPRERAVHVIVPAEQR